ncbi:MAG: hypothetical protein LBM70_08100 [Victivallales bacterium]|nr:hypothetical protein [Victivallales bacterium]
MLKSILLGTFILISVLLCSAEETNKTPIIRQDFENADFFAAVSSVGYTRRDPQVGQWGLFKDDKIVSISEEQAASGKYSLKYTAAEKSPYFAVGVFPEPINGHLELEFWVNRQEGFNFIVGLVTRKEGKNNRLLSCGTFDKNHQFAYLGNDLKWQRSGIKCPADEWVKLKFTLNHKENVCSYYVFLDDSLEKIGEVKFADSLGEVMFFELRPNASSPGSAVYLDDFTAFKTN